MPKSLPCLAMLVMLGPVLGRPAAAQDAPFADSLLVTLPMPKADAADAVVAAFTRAGLTVTNTMASLVEADQGSTKNSLIGGQYHRVVRAVLLPNDSGTNVLITGIETRNDEHGRTFKTLRIDNRAKGNGGLVWASMSEAATYLWYAAKDWQEKHAAPK